MTTGRGLSARRLTAARWLLVSAHWHWGCRPAPQEFPPSTLLESEQRDSQHAADGWPAISPWPVFISCSSEVRPTTSYSKGLVVVVLRADRDRVRRALGALHVRIRRSKHSARIVLPEPDVQVVVPQSGGHDRLVPIHRTGQRLAE